MELKGAAVLDQARNASTATLRQYVRSMEVGELCILRWVLEEETGKGRDMMEAVKISSWVEDELHSRAASAPCWPAERRRLVWEQGMPNLPIVDVDAVNVDAGKVTFDEEKLRQALAEHSWAVLRLPATREGDEAASVLQNVRITT